MIYYRCKCGKNEHWSSMGVPRCDFCADCGTTPATGPEGHRTERVPHAFMPEMLDTIEGPKRQNPENDRCRYCLQKRRELPGQPFIDLEE